MPERRRLTLSCSFSPLREVKTGQLTVFLNSFHSSDVVGIIGRDTYHHIRRASATAVVLRLCHSISGADGLK